MPPRAELSRPLERRSACWGGRRGASSRSAGSPSGWGAGCASRVAQFGYATNPVWRRYARGSRLLTVAGLAVYAWIIYVLGWSELVLSTAGAPGTGPGRRSAVLCPSSLIQLLIWAGLYLAERALHDRRGLSRPLPLYLVLRTRQSRGAGPAGRPDLRRCVRTCSPGSGPSGIEDPIAEPLELAGLAVLDPALPRRSSSAWPGRPDRCRMARSRGGWSGWPAGSGSASPTSWSGTPGT